MTRVTFCRRHGEALCGLARGFGCGSDDEVRRFIADCLEAELGHPLLRDDECPLCSFLDPEAAIDTAVTIVCAWRERAALAGSLN